MNDFLKHYKLKIHTVSPVHIGNGEKIGKKEYIYLPWSRKVMIPDVSRMYADLRKKRFDREYIEFMLGNGRDLGRWLKEHRYGEKDYQMWKRYELESGDAFEDRNVHTKEIDTFIKDAYGMPYIPGSSLKGMIRTALLAYELISAPERFRMIRDTIQKSAGRQANRKNCLSRETAQLENQVFHTLGLEDAKEDNALNCNLSGLIVSDSEAVSLERLILSQKIDYTLDGREKPLPILRETLSPGTDICFDLTIDIKKCPYTIENIMEALDVFQMSCYEHFYSRFHRGTTEKNIVWLGGGCGFLSKTVLYPLFGDAAVGVTDKIFQNILGKNYFEHKHNRDVREGVSPHVCKCTRYQGHLYDMGMCRIEVCKT